jgi:hypothetical protein
VTLHGLGSDPPVDAYNTACALALCIPIVEKDDQLDAAQRASAKQFNTDEAMKALRGAVAQGFHDIALMVKDTDLDPLRKLGISES